ncbi:Uncharacterised protein [Mycobacteroides abscessus subsp. abscessus]|nr:Uncharacterised protein [Mycobacteroides abscessus subsp. abscessus]
MASPYIKASMKSPNKKTVMYLDRRIFDLLIGRISRSLIVPHENSEATMPAATMMVKRPAKDINAWAFSTKDHTEYPVWGGISFSIWYSLMAICRL